MGDTNADGTLYVKTEDGEYVPLEKVSEISWTYDVFYYELGGESDEN